MSVSPVLSAEQLAKLASVGEERTAAVGDVLYRIGDERYPFVAILEGEAAVLDSAGDEIVRHGASGFLGELNLMTGQTVYLTAVVTQADALHRRRARGPAPDAVRRRPARRRAAVGVHRAARGAAAPSGHRRRDLRAAVVGRHPHDGRLPPPRPAAVHVARPRARRRSRGGRGDRRAVARRAAARAAAGRHGAAPAQQRRGLARAGDRRRAGGASGGRPRDRRRRARRAWAPRSMARPRGSTR